MSKKEHIVVTAALPYANGSIHLGHMVEYIQTDIYVRALKLFGKNAIFCCADDTHGAPIELKAMQLGITPEKLIAKYHKEHLKDFTDFLIEFDSYYSTNSPENKAFSDQIYSALKKKGYIYKKKMDVIYCPHDKRFLPDRYVKGTCPECKAEDQYGDVCEKCGKTHKTTDLINPKCSLCGNTPDERVSEHLFFKLSAFSKELKKFLKTSDIQDEVQNFVLNWIKDLKDWCISRDGPYFGFPIPGEENKFYYVWLDAPIGYIASTANYCKTHGGKVEDYWNGPNGKVVHVIGKDIMYFHLLFWPAMLMTAGFNLPSKVLVHGFLTVNKEKMSKSRGTFITAREYLEKYDPEYLRYYYASLLGSKMTDIDLDVADLKSKVNNELVANIGNFCHRSLSFLSKNFDGKIEGAVTSDVQKLVLGLSSEVKVAYETFNFKEVIRLLLEISSLGNKYFQGHEPWKLIKEDRKKVQQILGVCVNIAKILSVLIAPVLPEFSLRLQKQLNVSDLTWGDIDFSLKKHTIGDPSILVQKIEEDVVLGASSAAARDVDWNVDLKVESLGVKVRVVQINGVSVKKKSESLERLKKQLKGKLNSLEKKKVFAEYERLNKETGVDSKKNPNSVMYLLSLLKAKKLPQINTLVDAYNVVSLETGVSMATHDIAHLKGDVVVRLSKKDELFVALGGNVEKLSKGEVVYVDDTKVIGRFSKQCSQTSTTNSTKDVVLVAFGNKEISDKEMDVAVRKAVDTIVEFNGGMVVSSNFPLELRVGKVLSVEDHPDAEKLYVLSVDLGGEKRTIVSGLKDFLKPNEIKGKSVVVVCNLKPARLRGVVSNGMVLTAEKGKKLVLLDGGKSKPGTLAYISKAGKDFKQIEYKEFAAVTMNIKGKKVLVDGIVLKTDSGDIVVDITDGANVS